MPDSDAKSLITAFVSSIDGSTGQNPYALLSPDVVITINGTTPLSGRFEGLALVQKILVDTASGVIQNLQIKVHRLIGQGAKIATLLAVSGITRNGAAFNRQGELCGCVFEVDNGRIISIRAFPDTSLIDTALYGWQFVPNRKS
jgi:ketosteroid isomerase-like protein